MATEKPTIAAGRRPATRAEARALAHPLRLRILRLCLDEALTNRELADRLDEQAATVLYHVRTLERTGFLVREPERRGRRGAREIPYRSTRKSLRLEFGLDSGGHVAMIDAARAELADAGPEAVLTMSRLATRLKPEQLTTFVDQLTSLVNQAIAADEPEGEPIAIFVMVHGRA